MLVGVGVARQAGQALRAFARVFANPALRVLQLAGIGSTLGTWAYGVAISVYAYHAGGAKAVGLICFARWAAAGALAPWVGLLVDRRSRRSIMIASDLGRTVIVASMAALAALDQPSIIVFVLAVLSTVVSTAFPPAQGALLPSLVQSPDELTAANVVMSSVASVGMFAGPALGGLVLAVAGPSAVFAVTAGTLAWSALCVLRIPADNGSDQPPSAIISPAGVGPGFPLAQALEDDTAVLWLSDNSVAATNNAIAQLEAKAATIGADGGEFFYGPQLDLMFNDPSIDPRTPNIIVQPKVGVVYTGGTKKIAEHGGFAHDDTTVMMLVANPDFDASTINSPVETAQIAPTILKALGLDPHALIAVQKEGTQVLPGLRLGRDGDRF